MWLEGVIPSEDLDRVVDAGWTRERLVEALSPDKPALPGPLPTFADLLDAQQARSHWGALVVEEISKWCAAVFDQNQTTWKSPWSDAGFYADWKAAAVFDRNPEAFGLLGFRRFVATLPGDSPGCIRVCLARLSPRADLVEFLHRQLATVSG